MGVIICIKIGSNCVGGGWIDLDMIITKTGQYKINIKKTVAEVTGAFY